MSFFDPLIKDFRERRLWPVALVLLVALVAVPVLLSKTSTPKPPVPNLPQTGAAGTANPDTAVPAVSLSAGNINSALRAALRDPFRQQKAPGTTTTATVTAAATTSAGSNPTSGAPATTGSNSTTTSSTTSPTGSGGASGTGGTGSGGGSSPGVKPVFPTGKPKPAPTGLTATQSYRVTLAITNPAGGLDTIDPLTRLSVIPSRGQPLLVELGVLQGGNRVLFLVQPGAVVSGPGVCTPGRIDCEILSLAPGQIETLAVNAPTGVTPVAEFAVTAIGADQHPTAAAADQARRLESAAGRRLLQGSTSSALSLFPFKPGLGALVDLRNLTVGGN
jgi:hypothetical protein